MTVCYGAKILRPESAFRLIPPPPVPAWEYVVAALWLVAKLIFVISAVFCLLLVAAVTLGPSFGQVAFPVGMIIGLIGFMMWNAIN